MDANPGLQRFAQLLTRVRDQAISECDRLAGRSVRGPSGKRWQEVIGRESPQRTLSELVPAIVDQTLVQLFGTIDDGALPLQWQSEDGTIESLRDPGRDAMAGWLAGGDWPREYSTARRHGYLSDLRLVEPEDA